MKFGHIIIEKNGKKCSCGNSGCFEAYCSMRALKKNIAHRVKNEEYILGSEAYNIIKRDTTNVNQIVDEFLTNLNIGFSNYINVFEPEAICIGGGFIHYKDLLLDKLITKMHEENLSFSKQLPKIVTAEFRK